MIKKSMPELCRISVAEYKKSNKLPVCVVAEDVRAAHNIGAMLRTADAFRIAHIYMCGITPTPPNPDIHKTALGAEDSVEWSYSPDSLSVLRQLRDEGWTLCGLEQTHDSIPLNRYRPDKDTKVVIVAGNEVEGVSEEALVLCDHVLEIPQHGTKHSLNVSVAAALAMYTMYLNFTNGL